MFDSNSDGNVTSSSFGDESDFEGFTKAISSDHKTG